MARALLPLVDSSDAKLRRLAQQAALMVREIKFPGVNAQAGPDGKGRQLLTEALLRQPTPVGSAERSGPPDPQ